MAWEGVELSGSEEGDGCVMWLTTPVVLREGGRGGGSVCYLYCCVWACTNHSFYLNHTAMLSSYCWNEPPTWQRYGTHRHPEKCSGVKEEMRRNWRGGNNRRTESEGRGTDSQRKPYQVVWFPCAAGRPWRSPPSAGHLDCRELLDLLWMEEETEGGIGGRRWSGQLVLLIKAQWSKQDHLLAGARTGSHRGVWASLCCKPPVDFNVSKCPNRDQPERVQHTLW